MSKDGTRRVTIKIAKRVPEEEVKWVAEKLGVSEKLALKNIKEIISDGLWNYNMWRTYAVKDGELEDINTDDTDQYIEDGYEVFGHNPNSDEIISRES